MSRNAEITLRIKERMGRGDITRTDLADMTGISRPTISRRLGGGIWQADELEIITDALGVRWNWLMTGEGAAEEPHPDGHGTRESPNNGGAAIHGLGIKSPKLYQLSYRGTTEGSNVIPLPRRKVAA